MEAEVKVEKVLECLSSDFANGTLAYVGEDGIEEFAEECGTDASASICIQANEEVRTSGIHRVRRFGRLRLVHGYAKM